jgi:hypothetical protein
MPVPRPIDFETPATVGEASPAPRVVGALIDHPEQGKRCRNRFQHPDRRMLESLQIPPNAARAVYENPMQGIDSASDAGEKSIANATPASVVQQMHQPDARGSS